MCHVEVVCSKLLINCCCCLRRNTIHHLTTTNTSNNHIICISCIFELSYILLLLLVYIDTTCHPSLRYYLTKIHRQEMPSKRLQIKSINLQNKERSKINQHHENTS